MKKSEFNKLLNKITTKKYIDIDKIDLLTREEKSSMVYHIVRKRAPIVKELLSEGFDMSWLHSMGYLYETKGKLYTFVHTCEHRIF